MKEPSEHYEHGKADADDQLRVAITLIEAASYSCWLNYEGHEDIDALRVIAQGRDALAAAVRQCKVAIERIETMMACAGRWSPPTEPDA